MKDGCIVAFILFIVVAVVFSVIFNIVITFKTDIVIAKVSNKEAVVQNKTSKYLIFTDKEVFENTDSLIYGKWNSSDYYNKLEKDKTYRFKVCRMRIPFLSMYRNIIEYSEVKE